MLVAFVVCLMTETGSYGQEIDLDRRLATIRCKNLGDPQTYASLEKEALGLLSKYQAPGEKGQIYATIVAIYSDKGATLEAIEKGTLATKMLEYAQRALQESLGFIDQCQMYSCWTGALEMKYFRPIYLENSSGNEFQKARREIIQPCLKGLKIVLDHNAQKEIQPLPAVNMYDVGGNEDDPSYLAAVETHAKEVAARKEAEKQNCLVEFRRGFIATCVDLYSRDPDAKVEFVQIAGPILNNASILQEILTAIEEKRLSTFSHN